MVRVGVEQEDLQVVFAIEIYWRQEEPQDHRQDGVTGRKSRNVDGIKGAPQNEEFTHRDVGSVSQESEIEFHGRDSIKRS